MVRCVAGGIHLLTYHTAYIETNCQVKQFILYGTKLNIFCDFVIGRSRPFILLENRIMFFIALYGLAYPNIRAALKLIYNFSSFCLA